MSYRDVDLKRFDVYLTNIHSGKLFLSGPETRLQTIAIPPIKDPMFHQYQNILVEPAAETVQIVILVKMYQICHLKMTLG